MNMQTKSNVRMAARAGWGLLSEAQKVSDRLHIAVKVADPTSCEFCTIGFSTCEHITAPLTIRLKDVFTAGDIYREAMQELANG